MKSRIILALAIASITASAATPPPPAIEPQVSTAEDWSFRLDLPGWASAIDGTVGIRDVNVGVDASFSDILGELDFVFAMGAEVRRGRWGLLTDLMYVDLSSSASTPRGIAFSRVDVGLKQFLGNVAVSYRLVDNNGLKLDAFAGIRVNWLETEITLQGNAIDFARLNSTFTVASRSASDSVGWVDPLIGFGADYSFTDKVFIRGLADIGGFGVSSDLTWQAMSVLGYRFNKTFTAYAGYRAISTDYTDGGFTYDLVTHGPLLGLSISF